MKSKLGIVVVLSISLALIASGGVFAEFNVVSYTDTGNTGEEWFEPVGNDSLIRNGDFQLWTGGCAEFWSDANGDCIWQDNDAGWVTNLSMMDYASENSAEPNYAMGIFVRNVGGSAPYYVGTSNQLDAITAPGYYWVTVHVTAWETGILAPYHALAWYGFGSSADPASVSLWRELYPDQYVCANGAEICNHLGRYETVLIDAGAYMHIKVGHKFSTLNSWTVFGIDDISIVEAGGVVIEDGWIDDGDITWDEGATR